MDWTQLLARYAADLRSRSFAVRTIDNRLTLLKALAAAVDKPPAEVTREDLRDRQSRGIGASSMQRERADLRHFFSWAVDEGYLDSSPADGLKKVKVPRSSARPFTLEQVQAMLDSGCRFATRVMIILGAFQGLRAHEIAKIRGEDIDWTAGTLRVIGKGGYDAEVPMHPLVEEVARVMPRKGYWFPARGTNKGEYIHWRSVSDLVRRAKERAGIAGNRLTCHSLRHTFGTELVEAGVDIRIVQELMRHGSLQSTQIYTGVSARRKRDGIAAMPSVPVELEAGRVVELRPRQAHESGRLAA